MFLYTTLSALVGVIIALVLTIRTKRADDIVYCALDKMGIATNAALVLLYLCFTPVYLFIGMICEPAYDGLLGIVGWIVSLIIASTSFFCSLGLGLSVSLRRRGISGRSFAAQFMGLASAAVSLVLFVLFYGNLLDTLN